MFAILGSEVMPVIECRVQCRMNMCVCVRERERKREKEREREREYERWGGMGNEVDLNHVMHHEPCLMIT